MTQRIDMDKVRRRAPGWKRELLRMRRALGISRPPYPMDGRGMQEFWEETAAKVERELEGRRAALSNTLLAMSAMDD